MAQTPKKKTDYRALQSSFMRVPRMTVWAARALLDAGVSELYELNGRSAETLLADLRKTRSDAPDDLLPYFRLAVYYAEVGSSADPAKLDPAAWRQPS